MAASNHDVPERDHAAKAAVPLRILVVDDNEDSAITLSMVLKLLAYDAHAVFDGLQCLKAIRQHCPDVIFLDLALPKMSGFEVAKKIRQETRFDTIILIALTGYARDVDKRLSREAGFDHHLTKPTPFPVLKKLLENLAKERLPS